MPQAGCLLGELVKFANMEKRFLVFLLAVSLLCSCDRARQALGKIGIEMHNDTTKTEQTTDFSKLLKITYVQAGWSGTSSIDFPKIHLSVKNISGKAISEQIWVKYRFTVNDEVVWEGGERLHRKDDIPWNAELVKKYELDCVMVHYFTDNVKAEIYDDDNNLLWKGKVVRKIFDDEW